MISSTRWHSGIAIATLLLITALFNYHHSFPVLDIDFSINSQQAKEQGATLLKKNNLFNNKDYSAGIVKTNHQIKNYLELKSGPKKLQTWINKDLVPVVYWSVRFYQPEKTKETFAFLNPKGSPIGFYQKLPEKTALPLISKKEAIILAKKSLKDFAPSSVKFKLIDYSTYKQPNRIDHTLVFKDPRISLPDNGLNIRTVIISGNQITTNTPTVRIPESFQTHYADLRSYHNNLATASSIGMIILLILIGGQGVLYLIKNKLYALKSCFGFALAFSLLTLLNNLNTWSQSWFFYKTTTSLISFKLSLLSSAVISSISSFMFVGLLMATAEGLDRQIRPNGPQLFQCWRPKLLRSDLIKQHLTLGWFIFIGILIYVTSYYAITTHYFNFWLPTNTESDPNILSTPIPWVGAVIGALSAAVTEECWFRAIPIAMTSIWIQRQQKPSYWLYIVGTLSALIWAGGHANYPVSPYYARIIELFIAGIALNYSYLRFGLISVIIGHFLFDLLLMGMPIFMGSTASYFLSQSVLILLLSSPLLLWFATLTKPLAFDLNYINKAFKNIPSPQLFTQKKHNPVISTNLIYIVLVLSLLLCLTYPWIKRPSTITPLNISQEKALELANQHLETLGINLNNSQWERHTLATPALHTQQWDFINQYLPNLTKQHAYRLALSHPQWSIKWQRSHQDPTANLIDRQEYFEVTLNGSGEMVSYYHQLPENRKTEVLSKLQFIESTKPLLPNHGAWSLKDTSQKTHPQGRKDWSAAYLASTTNLPKNTDFLYNISMSGIKVLNQSYSLKLPEQWLKEYISHQTLLKHFKNIGFMALVFLIIYSLYLSIQHHAHQSKKAFFILLATLNCIMLPMTYLTLPAILFFLPTVGNYTQTLLIQIGMNTVLPLIGSIAFAGLLSTSLSTCTYRNSRPNHQMYTLGFCLGFALYSLNETLLFWHKAPQLSTPFISPYNTLSPSLYASLQGALQGLLTFIPLILISIRQRIPEYGTLLIGLILSLSLPSTYTQSLTLYLAQAVLLGGLLTFVFVYILSKDWRAFTAFLIGYKLIGWITLSINTPDQNIALISCICCLLSYLIACITIEKKLWAYS